MKSYRQRMIESFEEDPFECPYCKREMDLVGIWHSNYGWLYHYMAETETVKRWREYGLV